MSINPTATKPCGGCNVHFQQFDLQWYSEAYTHVAATVLKFVNNATNITTTSTIQGSTFKLPESIDYDLPEIVSNSVITTNIGGTVYTL